MGTQRLVFLDFCKFFGIAFMVWGHAGVPLGVDTYLHSFHMPIFFFVSGYLFQLDRYSFPRFVWGRARSLLIPYLVFGIGLCLLWNGYYTLFSPEQAVPWEDVFLRVLWMSSSDSSLFAAVQWFLPCLFFTEVAFYLLALCTRRLPWLLAPIAVGFSVLGVGASAWFPTPWPWGLDCGLSAIAFYSAGYGLRALGKFRAGQWLLSGPWYLLPVLFGGGLALSLWNGYVNLRLLLFGNYFLYYGAALCSILFYVLFSAWMARFPRFVSCPLGRWMACVGRNTLGILVLNQAVRQILVLALPWEEWQAAAPDAVYWMDGAMAFVVLWISFGLSLLLGKLAPWLVGKKRAVRQYRPKHFS